MIFTLLSAWTRAQPARPFDRRLRRIRDVDGVRRLLKEGKAAEARAIGQWPTQHWPMDGELHFPRGLRVLLLGEAHRAIGSV